jgi:hypothetical protein
VCVDEVFNGSDSGCVSIFVCIDVASAVNNRAPGGNCSSFSSLIIVV